MSYEFLQPKNILKVHPLFDLFLSIDTNVIKIINKQFQTQSEFKTNVKFTETGRSYLYRPVLCRGTIFVQSDENVYALKDQNLEFVATIPKFVFRQSEYALNCLFESNNQLYAHDNNDSLYILKNGKFEFVKGLAACQLYQFGNQVYAIGQRIWKLNTNSMQLNIITTGSSCVIGCAILGSDNVDMTTDLKLRRRGSNSSKQLSLGDAGLQLHDVTLSNLFGGEIIPRMKRVYENYLTKQMNFAYKHEISQLLTLTILLNNISPIIYSKYAKTVDRFNGVNERVLRKLYGFKKEIAEVGGLFGRVGAKYLELFDNAQQ